VTREKVTVEDVLELIELEQPPSASWTAAGFGRLGVFPDGAEMRVYGGPGDGVKRRRVTLRIAADPEIDPSLPRGPQARRRFEISGAGVRRERVLGLGEERVETFDICVPRGSSRLMRLRGTGAGVSGPDSAIEGVPIGLKVASIDVADAATPC
jgi:hypothetical protein